jgi:hypothetical protein
MAPFNCSIKTGPTPTFGRLVSPDKHIHVVMTEISTRAIGVMMTNKAKQALVRVTEKWSQYHQQDININTAVRDFQAILAHARDENSKWPAVVMDWTMSEQKNALYYFIPAAMTTPSPDYPIEAEYIALNGLVSHAFI